MPATVRPKAVPKGSAILTADFTDHADDPVVAAARERNAVPPRPPFVALVCFVVFRPFVLWSLGPLVFSRVGRWPRLPGLPRIPRLAGLPPVFRGRPNWLRDVTPNSRIFNHG